MTAPGSARTPPVALVTGASRGLGAAIAARLAAAGHPTPRGFPVDRLGVPDDVAGDVAYLVSEDASFVNGAWLTVNGGSVPG